MNYQLTRLGCGVMATAVIVVLTVLAYAAKSCGAPLSDCDMHKEALTGKP